MGRQPMAARCSDSDLNFVAAPEQPHPANADLPTARRTRRTNRDRHTDARHRLLPRLRQSIHGSGAAPGPRRTLRQRLPARGTLLRQLRLNPRLGRSVPARRGLERLRPHHRKNCRHRSFCRGGGKAARIRAAYRRRVPWATGSEPGCGGVGDCVGVKCKFHMHYPLPPMGHGQSIHSMHLVFACLPFPLDCDFPVFSYSSRLDCLAMSRHPIVISCTNSFRGSIHTF